MHQILDNIVWHTLSGPQAHFATGSGGVRRYALGFSPILGFADQGNPEFATLEAICNVGEAFYTDGWSGPVPKEWQLDEESTMVKMVWEGGMPGLPDSLGEEPLGLEHAQLALDLAVLTHPGPFGIRTIELGDYFGVFDGPNLIAMAGERMGAGKYREISGVCTQPDYQGRGLAKTLVLKLVRLQLERGQVPFLHVMSANTLARGLYMRMGFSEYKESVVRVISRQS